MAEGGDDEPDRMKGRTVVGGPKPGAPPAAPPRTLVHFDKKGIDDTMPAPGSGAPLPTLARSRDVPPAVPPSTSPAGSTPTAPGLESSGSTPTAPALERSGSTPTQSASGAGSAPTQSGGSTPTQSASGAGSAPTQSGSSTPTLGASSSGSSTPTLGVSSSGGSTPTTPGGADLAHSRPTSVPSSGALTAHGIEASPPGYSTTSGSHPRQILPGGHIGNFVVERHLGAGAMGIVLLARDLELGRPVAIKLLSAGDDPDAAQRLLREAQATARLSHSNVVAVHQVGTWEGQGFIVMEFVDGGTLREWLHARRAGWRDVIEAYRQAGQGLAAAHDAGLVHRDFKPDNCLVGRDGRVRVSDFGLVGLSDAPMTPAMMSSTHDSSLDGDPMLTRTGAMLGTPAYMAPEQFQGSRVDARADQFAFCVALYEALYGQRPFEGDTAATLLYSVLQGKVRPPPRSDVPAEVHRAILQGLAADPNLRHPNMAPLLRALAPKQGAPVAAIAGVSAAVVLLGGGAALYVVAPWESAGAASSSATAEDSFECPDPDAQVAEVWNPERREALEGVFIRTGAAGAKPMFDGTAQILDEFATQWADVHRTACTAMEEGETQRADLERQLDCLESRRVELGSMVTVLEEGDTLVIQGALGQVARLRPPKGCADADELRLAAQPPEDDELRKRLVSARERIVRGRLLFGGAKYDEARTIADEVVEELRALDYPPDLARALLLAGEVRTMQQDPVGAELYFKEAIELAAASKAHDVEASAWPAQLANLTTVGRATEAKALLAPAQAAAARAGDPLQSARIEMIAAQIYLALGDAAGGVERVSAAIDGFETEGHVPPYVELGLAYSTRGGLLLQQQRFPEARADYEKGLEYLDLGIGPRHSYRSTLLVGLAQVDHVDGKYDQAAARYEEGIDIMRSNHGEIEQISGFLTRWGFAEYDAGRPGRARIKLEEAIAQAEKTGGPQSRFIPEPLARLALLDYEAGEFDRALQRYGRTGAIYTSMVGAAHPQVAWIDHQRAAVMMAQGEDEAAVDLLINVAARFKAFEGRESVNMADTRTNLAELYVRLGQCDQAQVEIAEVRHIRKFLGSTDDLGALRLSVGASLCHVANGDIPKAEEELAEAKRLRKTVVHDDTGSRPYVDYADAHLEHAKGNAEKARRLMASSIDTYRKLGPMHRHMVDLGNAWLAKAAGSPQQTAP